MTRRAPREIAWCAISAAYGLASLALVVFWLLPSALASVSVLGTAVGLVCLAGGLRAARLLAALQRRALSRFTGITIDAPPQPERGGGLLVRLGQRLRDRAAWRAVAYILIWLPFTAVQAYVVVLGISGVLGLLLPLVWPVLHVNPKDTRFRFLCPPSGACSSERGQARSSPAWPGLGFSWPQRCSPGPP